MKTARQKQWELYLSERIPGWDSDRKLAVMLFVAVIPLVYGLAARSLLVAGVGIVLLIILIIFMSNENDQLSQHLSNFNKEFPE